MTAIDQHKPITGDPHLESEVDAAEEAEIYGVIGEFEDVDSIMAAAKAVREAGYRRVDVHSPFPIHGIDDVIGIRPTVLPWIVLICGLAGMGGGLFLTIFTMATDWGLPPAPDHIQGYEYIISGKPFASLPAYIPVIFETTILLAAFGAVFGMLLLNKLPLLYHPLFKSERFRRATSDRFFIVIEASDGKFDEADTSQFLENLGAASVEVVDE